MQVVVAECGSAQHARQGRQVAVALQTGQFTKRFLVVTAGRGETGTQKTGAQHVSGDHLIDLRSGAGLRVVGEAVLDSAQAFLRAVVGGSGQVDLAELGEDLQRQIVAVRLFDLGQQGQQEFLGRLFFGGQGQLASALQLAGNRHGCIISRTTRRSRRPAERRT